MALVVKVKYGNTLRRFNLYASKDGSPELSLNGLKSKICELFKFDGNAQLVITYKDEDNDVITMVDEDDILDVLHQGLNPLRLEVSLASQNDMGGDLQSQNGSSTPKSSTAGEQGQSTDSRIICPDEALKLVSEPLRKVLMKCVKDPVVKAVASTPAVSEFMEGLIRIASTRIGPLSEGQQGVGANDGTKANNSNLAPISDGVNQSVHNFQPAPPSLSVPSAPPLCGEINGNVSKKNSGFSENMHRTFHRGVQCDGCGITPIVGPRYKSTVKEDYDLCYNCFSEMGNDDEYLRIDRALYRPPRFCRVGPLHGGNPFHKPSRSHPFGRSASMSCARGPGIVNRQLGKLDCRFVQDVTILDGTLLAPGTPFTKIWRLRNNGTLRWPPHTQLVRVGGDELGASNTVNMQIQEQGHPVDEELDAVVDFIAPIQPGRYVSYWRLMAPSGQKFGQRVWVLIQVETPKEDFLPRLMESLLTLKEHKQKDLQVPNKENMLDVDPPSQLSDKKASTVDGKINLDAPDVVCTEVESCSMVEHPRGKSSSIPLEVVDVSMQVQETDICTQVQGASLNSPNIPSSLGPSLSAYVTRVPVHGASEGHVAVSAGAPSLAGSEMYSLVTSASDEADKQRDTSHSFFKGASDVTRVEQRLLAELEEMGFNQRKLNAEVLRRNNYDLQETLDHLCSTAEWDPILEELEEMGFCDLETNKRLLLKNEGSVKRVVLDLLSAEKVASLMQSNVSEKAKKK
eukprot:Gb_13685 [translate_table: standard]